MAIPKFHDMFNPILKTMHFLGKSAKIETIDEMAAYQLGLPDSDMDKMLFKDSKTCYRMGWARYYLKANGLITNPKRGYWVLTPKGKKTKSVDPKEIIRHVRTIHNKVSVVDRRKLKRRESDY